MRTRQGKKDILLNMPVLAQDLMNLVKNDSEIGRGILLKVIDEAREEYSKPTESLLQGRIYQCTRKRLPEIDRARLEISRAQNGLHQALSIKTLICNGKWNQGSFNTSFMLALIKTTDAYWMPSAVCMQEEIIPRLRDLLLMKINTFIKTELETAEEALNQKTKEKLEIKPGRINLEDFSRIGALFDTERKVEKKVAEIKPGRIDTQKFNNIASLFGSPEKKLQKPGRIKNLDGYKAVADLFAAGPVLQRNS